MTDPTPAPSPIPKRPNLAPTPFLAFLPLSPLLVMQWEGSAAPTWSSTTRPGPTTRAITQTKYRAVARAATGGPAAALAPPDPLAAHERLAGYQPYWAARGALLARVGRTREAREALTRALGLA